MSDSLSMLNLSATAKLRPIAEAPKDGTVILAWCDHEAASYYCDKTGRLSAYGANAEGMSHVDNGWNLIRWEEGFFDGECHLPAWWFLVDGCGETAANPVLWVALPANPKPEDFPGTDNSLVVDDKVLSPAQQAGEQEAVEVVGWLGGNGLHGEFSDATGAPFPLMTVAQHNRILAAWQRTQSAGVPEGWRAAAIPAEKPLPELMMASYHEAIGWNACRQAMLAAPAQPAAHDQGEVQRLVERTGYLVEFVQQMARQQGEPYYQKLAKAALKKWSGL